MLAWMPRLLAAAGTTFMLFVVVALGSVVLGLAMALTQWVRPTRALSAIFAAFSWFFRGVPELIVLFLCYLGLPRLGLDLSPLGAAILGFTLVGAAYDFQVFRGALTAIPAGQIEAARALGLRTMPMLALVVMPQMMRLAATPWITYATGAIKRMSIASAIAVSEVLLVTKQAIALTNQPFEFLALAVLLYAGMASVMMALDLLLQRRLAAGAAPRVAV